MKIEPITRSISVSRKLGGIWLSRENGTITFYTAKDDKELFTISEGKLHELLKFKRKKIKEFKHLN